MKFLFTGKNICVFIIFVYIIDFVALPNVIFVYKTGLLFDYFTENLDFIRVQRSFYANVVYYHFMYFPCS